MGKDHRVLLHFTTSGSIIKLLAFNITVVITIYLSYNKIL